jgi:hypothetical protein
LDDDAGAVCGSGTLSGSAWLDFDPGASATVDVYGSESCDVYAGVGPYLGCLRLTEGQAGSTVLVRRALQPTVSQPTCSS